MKSIISLFSLDGAFCVLPVLWSFMPSHLSQYGGLTISNFEWKLVSVLILCRGLLTMIYYMIKIIEDGNDAAIWPHYSASSSELILKVKAQNRQKNVTRIILGLGFYSLDPGRYIPVAQLLTFWWEHVYVVRLLRYWPRTHWT